MKYTRCYSALAVFTEEITLRGGVGEVDYTAPVETEIRDTYVIWWEDENGNEVGNEDLRKTLEAKYWHYVSGGK